MENGKFKLEYGLKEFHGWQCPNCGSLVSSELGWIPLCDECNLLPNKDEYDYSKLDYQLIKEEEEKINKEKNVKKNRS